MGQFNEYHQYREAVDATIEVIEFEQQLLEWKKTHPAKGISEKKKSDVVKKAKRGEKIFGGGFDKIEKEAGKRYGDDDAGKRVAGAIMWKKVKGKHMTKEDVDDMIWIVEDDMEVILDHAIQDREQLQLLDEKNWIQKAVNPEHKGFCTPMTKKTCTGHRKSLAKRFKHGDIHQDNVDED